VRRCCALSLGAPAAAAPLFGARGCYLSTMIDKRLFEELNERISEAMRNSPAQDFERNLRALLAGWFDRFDLVSREDFDVQRKLLERAQLKLAELETRIAELEARRPPERPG
jgi:ubiquinone biosynthesis accessory factor UbiK